MTEKVNGKTESSGDNKKEASGNEDVFDQNLDNKNAFESSLHHFYGPKIHLTGTDRDLRIAFGTSFRDYENDPNNIISKYKVAVYLPWESAADLHRQLESLLKSKKSLDEQKKHKEN